MCEPEDQIGFSYSVCEWGSRELNNRLPRLGEVTSLDR